MFELPQTTFTSSSVFHSLFTFSICPHFIALKSSPFRFLSWTFGHSFSITQLFLVIFTFQRAENPSPTTSSLSFCLSVKKIMKIDSKVLRTHAATTDTQTTNSKANQYFPIPQIMHSLNNNLYTFSSSITKFYYKLYTTHKKNYKKLSFIFFICGNFQQSDYYLSKEYIFSQQLLFDFILNEMNKFQHYKNYQFNSRMSSNRICLKRKDNQKRGINPTIRPSMENILEEPTDLPTCKVQRTSSIAQSAASTNENIFQQFKIQYDEIRLKYEEKMKEVNQLQRDKKKLQIHIMSNDTKYFEKEIKRLREQVEKYQEENEDNKHKYFIAENQKKEFEATVKLRSEENKQMLQRLQKQKVTVVELRHQISEKEKFYKRMTSEMQRSNSTLSINFEQTNSKCNKLETSYKAKCIDFENLQRNYEVVSKKLSESEALGKTNKQIFDRTNFEKSKKIDELETSLRQLNRTSRDTIQKLQINLQEIKTKRNTENLLVNDKIESANKLRNQMLSQLELVRQQENNKQLKLDLEDKCKLVKSLQKKLLETYSQEQYQELQSKIKDLQKKKTTTCKFYEDKILKIQKQNETMKLSQLQNPGDKTDVNPQFQDLLKNQIQENAKTKKQLTVKVDQLYNAKADLEQQKSKTRLLEDEINLLHKKIKSQDKNHKIQIDVSSQNMKNDIDSLRRKLQMLENKVKAKTKEVKEKENFIMNTIVGRSKQEDIPLILAQLQRIFETDYLTKLAQAQERIEELSK